MQLRSTLIQDNQSIAFLWFSATFYITINEVSEDFSLEIAYYRFQHPMNISFLSMQQCIVAVASSTTCPFFLQLSVGSDYVCNMLRAECMYAAVT